MASSTNIRRLILSIPLLLLAIAILIPHPASASRRKKSTLPDLASFIESVKNGDANTLRGVYVNGIFALPVVQQPVYGSYDVSNKPDALTEFGAASAYGNVGLLAHNYLSGRYFSRMTTGLLIELVYGDGRTEYFTVTQIIQYQATDPFSVQSNFIDLNTKESLSANQLFRKVYMGPRHVTFQTCIDANGNSSWGRLFVIAVPEPVNGSN